MESPTRASEVYKGFEQGPIRPPNEAHSLLIRVSRNCPWNRCLFCPVYKTVKFSHRPVEHVKADIDLVHKHVERLRQAVDSAGELSPAQAREAWAEVEEGESTAFAAAFNWLLAGKTSCAFLQDADVLLTRTDEVVEILLHLRKRFPGVERVTCYARAATILRKTVDELQALRDAGLNRVHVGLESGSDEVLATMHKGVTKAGQIEAGLKAKQAGIELSEYVMPGLGGKRLSETHALETADALNRIDPDFIRFRTLAIPASAPLFEKLRSGGFEKCTDLMVIQELLKLVENLSGISSVVKSDHILNILPDLEGTLPKDKEQMTDMLRAYLAMEPHTQHLFQLGRRLGILTGLEALDDPQALAETERAYRSFGVTPQNLDDITDRLMTGFL